MEKLRTCFFTGHRRIPNDKLDMVKRKIAENIERLIIEYEVNNFISGGALGFDTIAAEAVVKMKERYPHIRLILYLPCYNQSKRWTDIQKYYHHIMMSKADDIVYVTEGNYTENCMRLRNMEMIKSSFFCIAYCVSSKSGTGFTVRNAERVGIEIINTADEI